MTTRMRDPGGSWWWAEGGDGGGAEPAGGGEWTYGEMCENERRRREQMAALGGYQLQEVAMAAPQNQQVELDSDIFQLSYPRPRLRWTAELHDQFVKAVDQLGGANKATPKAILNLMGVQGLTLYHLKSHLQKFRLGKTGRRLWKKDFIPANYCNRLGAETYGNLHLLVEPQPAVENFEMTGKIPGLNTSEVAGFSATTTMLTTNGVKLEEEFGDVRPALLPLFPPIPACGMMDFSPEWSEYHLEGGRRSVGPSRPVENASMDDYLGYSSSESCRASMIFRTFFDEVASFSKVDPDAADANVVAVEPHDLSAGSVAHYYP